MDTSTISKTKANRELFFVSNIHYLISNDCKKLASLTFCHDLVLNVLSNNFNHLILDGFGRIKSISWCFLQMLAQYLITFSSKPHKLYEIPLISFFILCPKNVIVMVTTKCKPLLSTEQHYL